MVRAVENGELRKGEKTVVVLRYLGPKDGPGMMQHRLPVWELAMNSGMPEMLKPTSLIMGADLGRMSPVSQMVASAAGTCSQRKDFFFPSQSSCC
jgi:dihydroxyacid dehydratase/phosphogluconate dehydratase